MVQKLGEEWVKSWWKGLPGTYETPTGDDPTSAASCRFNAVLLDVDAVTILSDMIILIGYLTLESHTVFGCCVITVLLYIWCHVSRMVVQHSPVYFLQT